MVSQQEVDFMSMKIEALEKESVSLNKKYQERGKSLNKLWEKRLELVKDLAKLKEIYGKLTYDFSQLYLENRIMIPSAAKIVGCENKQFLVKDIVRQLIKESGYDLEFKILQPKFPTKPALTITGEEIKK